MNVDLERLLSLQDVDGRISVLKAEIAALPKRVQQIESKLASARKRVDDAKAAIKANEHARRNHEQDIQSENTKVSKFRDQSSSVKTNEQYKALLHEISFSEQAIRGYEDKILDAMVELEAHQAELKAAEAALTSETEVNNREKAEATQRSTETERELAALVAQRNELRGGIDESLLVQYDRVSRGRGTGLAEARGQRCMGCQVMLRPQVWSVVQSGGVQSCDACSRILYYNPEKAEPAPAASNIPQVERDWLFLPAMGEHGAFVVLVNSKGNATMKAYDALTGSALEKHTEKGTTYQQAFADLLRDGRNLFVDEPGIEDKHKEQLPPEILEDLRHQIPRSAARE